MSSSSSKLEVRFSVPPLLAAYAEAAVARLGYLYPASEFTIAGCEIRGKVGELSSAANFRREVQYALYREKIYSETLPLRNALVTAVTQRR